MGYFAQQSLDLLDPDLTIKEQLEKDFPKESIGALRSLAGAFQFSGDDTDKKIRALSGGEKTRLVLARMLLNPPNFLVLDEPTNHLDLATKEMLLDSLKDFDGTMLFVSHDREFLRGLSNRVLELGGESGTEAQPHAYPGLLYRVRRAHRPRSARRARVARLAGPAGAGQPAFVMTVSFSAGSPVTASGWHRCDGQREREARAALARQQRRVRRHAPPRCPGSPTVPARCLRRRTWS